MTQMPRGDQSNSSSNTIKLRTVVHESLLEISFCNEASMNAIDYETARELHELLSDLHLKSGYFQSRPIGAVLFTSLLAGNSSGLTPGAGIFLSGGNLKEIADSPARARSTMLFMQENCSLLQRLPCISICLLSGRAIGGGAEFALATDERWLASPSATLELKQRDWGLSSGWFGLSRLAELRPRGGYRSAALDFATGRIWSADALITDQLCELDLRNTSDTQKIQRAIQTSQSLLACSESLRKELLMQERSRVGKLEILELLRFEKFWGAADHLRALEKYKTSKTKGLSENAQDRDRADRHGRESGAQGEASHDELEGFRVSTQSES